MNAIFPKIPLASLLSLTKPQLHSLYSPFLRYDNITVGAIIFKPSTARIHKLLLLKRAAHDPAFPNMFAIPGGHVEDTDLSIFHGLKREVLEKTKMLVQGVIDQIDPLAWVTERPVEGGDKISVGKFTSLQLNFVCDVEGWTVHVDPEEHSVGVWADREEADMLDMSLGMKRVVENAFRWKEAVMGRESKS